MVAWSSLALLGSWPTGTAAAFLARPVDSSIVPRTETRRAEWTRSYAAGGGGDADEASAFAGSKEGGAEVPPFVTSPVLRAVYPALLDNVARYGHPNIPLGTADGRRCKTLRRLAFQGKLSPEEMDLVAGLGFRFTSFEDVYDEADFDDCFRRLLEHEEEHGNGYQVPKKYKEDPELGAWVTMLRRIGRDNMEEERRRRLDGIGFSWVSRKKCGSSFMKNFRPLLERLEEGGEGAAEEALAEEGTRRWLRAQRDAFEKGNLSEARVGYLDQLPGVNWRSLE